MTVFWKLEPTLRRNLVVFFAASLCFWGGLSGMLPVLALYVGSYSDSNQEIGWVMAAFAAGLLFFRPRMSRLIDSKGRKPALLIGVLVIAIAPLLYLAVGLIPQVPVTLPWIHWQFSSVIGLLFLIRAFHGISVAAFATAYTAAVADMAPPQHRGELIGTMSLASPIGMAFGPALGGYLIESSFTLAFWAMAAVGAVGTLCVLSTQEPPRPERQKIAHQAVHQSANRVTDQSVEEKPPLFWSLLWLPAVRIPALILFMIGIAFGAMVTFIPLYVQVRAWEINVGLVYTASAIASFSIRAFAGTASDQLGRGRFISLGMVFYTLSMGMLFCSVSPNMLLLAGVLQGAGAGTTIPIIAALMADRSRPHERGLMFGLCLTGFDLGIALAGPLMGRVADYTGSYAVVFGLAGLMTLLGLLLFVTTSSKDISHSVRFALGGGIDVYAIK
ncbi:MAG: MFS transporter [Cyanobacteria bacterium J06623_5]